MTEETIYLHDVPLSDAWSRFIQALEAAKLWTTLESELIPLDQALGRVIAEPIWAKASSPHYHASAMDGFALRSKDTMGASDRTPIKLEVDSQATYVDTGDAMPGWADAVIPIENVEPTDDEPDRLIWSGITIRTALAPWTHVRPMGEDIVTTELVLPEGAILRPVDLGAIAGSGYSEIRVWRRPRVAIIPTGSELVPIGTRAERGQILEYNSLVLAAQIQDWGGTATRFPITPDAFDSIREATLEAADDHDLILINAGSSAGSEDFTAEVIQSIGEVFVHGIAVRPGHPVILGMIKYKDHDPHKHTFKRIPVIGVPGYPVSAAITGEIFVEPILSKWLGRISQTPETTDATLTRKVHSSLGDDEYLRVTVGKVGNRTIAAPLSRGAGNITSLVRADGIVRIPSGVQGLHAGEQVQVHLYRSRSEIERTILIQGSHDLTIDLLAQYLSFKGLRLASSNLGSLGGLLALKRGEAHLAGSHLLDPETGEYNLRYIKEYIPQIPVVIMGMVQRDQGLILPKGNPKRIYTMEDLAREDVSFVNRQRGAGTRLLLDYHLEQLGLSPDQIDGYDRMEYTHLAVAAAVDSKMADCGLGIHAAASALNLDFIPLFEERYDLVIPVEHYEGKFLLPMLEILDDEEFRKSVENLPGYSTSVMGEIIDRTG